MCAYFISEKGIFCISYVKIEVHISYMKVKSESEVTQLCPTLCDPISMGFSRQEYWSGLPFSSPEYLPSPGIEPRSPALQADSLPTELQGKPTMWETSVQSLGWEDPLEKKTAI